MRPTAFNMSRFIALIVMVTACAPDSARPAPTAPSATEGGVIGEIAEVPYTAEYFLYRGQ
jgi:hypothetical protein